MLVGLPRWCRRTGVVPRGRYLAGVAARALAYRCCVAQALYRLAADALPAHHPNSNAPIRLPLLPKRRQAHAAAVGLLLRAIKHVSGLGNDVPDNAIPVD